MKASKRDQVGSQSDWLAGMSTFVELDRALETESIAGPSKLRHIIEGDGSEEEIDGAEPVNGVVGEKRKL